MTTKCIISPWGKNTERRRIWLHRISRRDFNPRRAYLCENTLRTPSKTRSRDTVQESLKVYCRIRCPENEEEDSVRCIKLLTSNTVSVTHLPATVNYKTHTYKEVQYVFQHVFGETATQKDVFDGVALPLVEALIRGENGLLFAYGVTGGGKTFTMTGNSRDEGVIPRCLDVIFNSISKHQARKFMFKPDKMNGFEVLSESEALLERQRDIHNDILTGKPHKTPRKKDGDELLNRVADITCLPCANESNMYSVFISYVEIYNNSIYDLLEDVEDTPRTPQSRIVREDGNRNMYVHLVTEIEVKSSTEAFKVFYKGQKKKRMASTSVNTGSSRSHSVFTIRLVQCPLDCSKEAPVQDNKLVHVSQLCLVDLAGCERTNRTKNTGHRLQESGNINNSLMTLRSCLEILRENQQTGSHKMVPYRDSKLTLLFKSYFEGEGKVSMIVCLNPLVKYVDETVQVLRFAETTQEVQVTVPPTYCSETKRGGNHVNNQQAAVNIINSLPYHNLSPPFPKLKLEGPEDEVILTDLISFLELRIARRKCLHAKLLKSQAEFRNQLSTVEMNNMVLSQENSSLQVTLETERKKNVILDNKVMEQDNLIASLEKSLKEKDKQLLNMDAKMKAEEERLAQLHVEMECMKEGLTEQWAAEKNKLVKDMHARVRLKKLTMKNQLRQNKEKLKRVKDILCDDAVTVGTPALSDYTSSVETDTGRSPPSSCRHIATPSTNKTQSVHLPVSPAVNRNCISPPVYTPARGLVHTTCRRRSRSVEKDMWIDHRSGIPKNLDTVLQPHMKKRKKITKLTDIKDVTGSKVSKYCLVTQDRNSEGEIETNVFKADVESTISGGAQVVFNELETLILSSPTSPRKRRSSRDQAVNDASQHQNSPMCKT